MSTEGEPLSSEGSATDESGISPITPAFGGEIPETPGSLLATTPMNVETPSQLSEQYLSSRSVAKLKLLEEAEEVGKFLTMLMRAGGYLTQSATTESSRCVDSSSESTV